MHILARKRQKRERVNKQSPPLDAIYHIFNYNKIINARYL
jgi:hypothetical protein